MEKAMAKTKVSKVTKTCQRRKKYEKIYYNDGSGDNIPAIVCAMRKMDVNKAPLFVVN